MTSRATHAVMLACLFTSQGCMFAPAMHVAPPEKAPHATVRLHSVYMKIAGPSLNQQLTVDGLPVARAAARDAIREETLITRTKPGPRAIRLAATFFHTTTRTEQRARTEQYACGTNRIGNSTTTQYCTRTVYDNVTVTNTIVDGECATAMRVPFEDGATYVFDYVYRDNKSCSLQCRVRVPTPDGAEEIFMACEGATAPAP